MRRAVAILALALPLAAAACGGHPVAFRAAPPVTHLRDDAPIPLPRPRPVIEPVVFVNAYVRQPLVDALDPTRTPYAQDVNAIDQVLRSSWFDPPPAERLIAVGPPHLPVRRIDERHFADARGLRWHLVIDPAARPNTESAAAVIAARLFRRLGYLTPESHRLSTEQVAALKLPKGRTAAAVLALGIPLGATDPTGTRSDDDNDRIAHEDRRTLRALGVLAHWLDLPRLGPRELTDVYVGSPGRGYVLHLVGGLSHSLATTRLGAATPVVTAAGTVHGDPWMNLITLGLYHPQRRRSDEATLRALPPRLGSDLSLRDPFPPVERSTPADDYWITKRLAALSVAEITAAVAAGGLPEDVARHLVSALDARRAELARRHFARVSPVEVALFDATRLTLVDLGVTQAGVVPAQVRYDVRVTDRDDHALRATETLHTRDGEFAVNVAEALRRSKYVIVHVTARRNGAPTPEPAQFHLATDGVRARVIGVRH